jgi:tetratricopeptide (TPR) repeat protein
MDPQEYQEMIDKINTNELDIVKTFLDENRLKYEKDPEYYVILLNYSFTASNKLIIAQGEPQEGDIAILDKETGDVVGFMGDRQVVKDEIILKALNETQKALQYFNDRLDIRFGIIHIAQKFDYWDILQRQLSEILVQSKIINNRWKWGSINSMDGDPREFMLENVQSKINELFYKENENADNAIESVSKVMIKEYPDVIYGYSNLGALYLAQSNFDLAEKYLNLALSIDPNDKIVKGNLDFLKQRRNK